MLSNHHIELVKKLIRLTDLRKLEWKKAVSRAPNVTGNAAYQVSIGNATIRLSVRDSERSTQPDYIITILNGEGNKVEAFSDVDLESTGGIDEPFSKLQSMYSTAARIALGADEILNDILSGLDEIDPENR